MSKITLVGARDVALDRLVASDANVRRLKAGVSVEELAEDIARRGLLQSLSVRPIVGEGGEETGKFAVSAGGRRLAALKLLVKQKRLAKNAPVPCIVKTEGIEEEDSLAENTMREALHPLDQFRAFKRLHDQGVLIDEIAARFFVTPQVVRQRLKLAAASQKLLDLYVTEVLSLLSGQSAPAFPPCERVVQVVHRREPRPPPRGLSRWRRRPWEVPVDPPGQPVDWRWKSLENGRSLRWEAARSIRARANGGSESWIDDHIAGAACGAASHPQRRRHL
jgi:ParB family chromosome partitioning protein